MLGTGAVRIAFRCSTNKGYDKRAFRRARRARRQFNRKSLPTIRNNPRDAALMRVPTISMSPIFWMRISTPAGAEEQLLIALDGDVGRLEVERMRPLRRQGRDDRAGARPSQSSTSTASPRARASAITSGSTSGAILRVDGPLCATDEDRRLPPRDRDDARGPHGRAS